MRAFACLSLCCLLTAGLALGGEALRLAGVLGNSGSLERPVLFGDRQGLGNVAVGCVYDESRGVVYERAGRGLLNAYALDGRLVASHPLIPDANHMDMMARCGDLAVLLLANRLFRLPLGAPDGAAPEEIHCAIKKPLALSASAKDGRLAVAAADKGFYWLDPRDGKTEKMGAGDVGLEYCNGMDFAPDGSLTVFEGRTAHSFANGAYVKSEAWPRRYVGDREGGGERMRLLDGAWWGGAWHGTVKRFDAALAPAPGVVLGGASGHFIGHVPCNYDADDTRGLALVRPGLFALPGMNGVVQLAAYDPRARKMRLLRRLGALPEAGGLAIDAAGNVLAGRNVWAPGADSRSPAAVSVVFAATGPAAAFDADTFVYPCSIYGGKGLAWGKLEEQGLFCNGNGDMKWPKDLAGVAVYPLSGGEWVFLALGRDGETRRSRVVRQRDKAFAGDLGECKIATARPVKAFTGLTGPGDGKALYAAADGQVLVLERDGEGWKEKARWGEGLGRELRLAWGGGLLAIADAEKGALVVATPDGRARARVAVEGPGDVAFNGRVAVVHQPAKQRLLKFALTAEP